MARLNQLGDNMLETVGPATVAFAHFWTVLCVIAAPFVLNAIRTAPIQPNREHLRIHHHVPTGPNQTPAPLFRQNGRLQ